MHAYLHDAWPLLPESLCLCVQYYEYESYAPYGTNGTHQVSRVTTKV